MVEIQKLSRYFFSTLKDRNFERCHESQLLWENIVLQFSNVQKWLFIYFLKKEAVRTRYQFARVRVFWKQ